MRWSDKPAINHGKLFYYPHNELPIIGSDTFTWSSLPSILNPEHCNPFEGLYLPFFRYFSDGGCCSFCLLLIVLYSPPSKFLFITYEMTTALVCDHGMWPRGSDWPTPTSAGLWLALLWPRSNIHLAPPGPWSHGSEASLLSRCHDVTMTHEAWPHPVRSTPGW